MVAEKSRADYFRKRRKLYKQFTVSLKKDKFEAFEIKLKEMKKTRTEWLNTKIDDELKK